MLFIPMGSEIKVLDVSFILGIICDAALRFNWWANKCPALSLCS